MAQNYKFKTDKTTGKYLDKKSLGIFYMEKTCYTDNNEFTMRMEAA